jgi:DNA recombination protein RmuC
MNILMIVTMACSIISLILTTIILVTRRNGPGTPDYSQLLQKLALEIEHIGQQVTKEFTTAREESSRMAYENRNELSQAVKDLKKDVVDELRLTTKVINESSESLSLKLEEKFNKLTASSAESSKEFRLEISETIKQFASGTTTQLDNIAKANETKLVKLLEDTKVAHKESKEDLNLALRNVQETLDRNVKALNETQKERFGQLDEKQIKLVDSTEKRLDQLKEVVDEKLSKTLHERLGQSFDTVGKQLIEVQKGLGEMQTLAQDVGGLKRVLSNVKMRGGIGEVQLSLLLEQVLAPEQYSQNVKTKSGSNDMVEFAIKLPGQSDTQSQMWLPVDAKFPKEHYELLQDAYECGDVDKVDHAQKLLESAIRKMAKDVRDKYIDPPNTTDFGIIFLPFEGIFAEVVRKAAFLEELQREYRIVVTGPTTLAAILNSLQIGFRTLAIQKRSSEVWQVLGAVKREFENFGGMLSKAQNNFQTGMNQLDDVLGKRTRAIERKLRGVEALSEADSRLLLPEVVEMEVEE